jgi:hypothetical protein
MRYPVTIAIVGLAALSGCLDGTNPFMVDSPDGTGSEQLDENDPNTDVNNQFLYDPDRGLTMNAVQYDAANDELVINNLPFDGPDGRYDNIAGTTSTDANGITSGVYESRQTATTGLVKHYAVFVRGDYLEATAANSRDWFGFGYGGANINRSDFGLPSGIGEYVYRGVYGGARTFDNGGGIELTAGDATLILDVLDFDPIEGIQGAIAGDITNHVALAEDGTTVVDNLPDVILAVVSFSTDQGVFEGGEATTALPVSGGVADTGSYEGIFGGPDGEEIGGYTVLEGPGNVQVTTVETIQWTYTFEQDIIVGGVVVGTQTITQTGTTSGFDSIPASELQEVTNAGGDIPAFIGAPTSGIPAGADTVSTTQTFEFLSDYQAREVGVFVTTQQ